MAVVLRPYNEDMIPPYEEMMMLPAVAVLTRNLLPTQPIVLIEHLLSDVYQGLDPCPHVVELSGRLYVHNGHHRWMRAYLRGIEALLCRVWSANMQHCGLDDSGGCTGA